MFSHESIPLELPPLKVPRKFEGSQLVQLEHVKQMKRLLRVKRWQDCSELLHLKNVIRSYQPSFMDAGFHDYQMTDVAVGKLLRCTP